MLSHGKKKILIAEDERPISKALELKLIKEGFDAKAVYDGEEAMEFLEKEKFDLILLDIIMPKMNGFQVMEKIREKEMNIPIIVTSNLSQDEDIKKAKDLGAKAFLIKSNTSLDKIIKTIKSVLE
jgi:DNA-binding response OmpR family regulator